ncbi:suppressor of fused domain protein [Solwaraspora sp. WMMD792]|uniref:suppressor of fused domain protein n=1 Tax=Solwaraspora sp. WMMD792 TaxID=3016099 RepID=UPI0024160510|nr:suppressor of fused domain protein [Solwaraspora sp. WMMD792]MDG4772987.1 suppressor of fused domain protein [Solwaraspora sp. WMMD792]
MSPDARTIAVPDGSRIALLAVVPLHADEMAVKIEHGTDALIEILDRGGVTELLDPQRSSYA